jgi:hypothetical protein
VLTPLILLASLLMLGLATFGVVSAMLTAPVFDSVGVIRSIQMIEPEIWI